MNSVTDLRDIFVQTGHRLLQLETKYGEVLQGKWVIVDYYSGRKGIFRRITDFPTYQASHGMQGVQELTLHAIDIRGWRLLE